MTDMDRCALRRTHVFYIARKIVGVDEARKILEDVLANLGIAEINQSILQTALDTSMRDFEDAVQYACAVAVVADAIVTRDPKGWPASSITILSPADFLVLVAPSDGSA